eukprot:gene3084-biopygen7119
MMANPDDGEVVAFESTEDYHLTAQEAEAGKAAASYFRPANCRPIHSLRVPVRPRPSAARGGVPPDDWRCTKCDRLASLSFPGAKRREDGWCPGWVCGFEMVAGCGPENV